MQEGGERERSGLSLTASQRSGVAEGRKEKEAAAETLLSADGFRGRWSVS